MTAALAACRSANHYIEAGNKFFEAGQFDAAMLNYRKALQKDSNSGEAYYRLGLAALKAHKPAEGFQALSNAVARPSQHDDARVKLTELCLAAYGLDTRRPRIYYDQLVSLSQQFLLKDPKSYHGLRIKGHLAYWEKKSAEAVEFFQRAAASRPGNAEALVELAWGLIQNDQLHDAERTLREAIQSDNSYGRAYDSLHTLYKNTGRTAEGERILRLKVENNPRELGPVLQLAHHFIDDNKPAEADSTLRQLLDNPKDFPSCRLQIGDFYRQRRDLAKARQHYTEGLRVNLSQELEYLKRLASLAVTEGNTAEATRLVNRVLVREPQDDEALRVKADLLVTSRAPGDMDKAIQIYQALLAKNRLDTGLYYRAGRAYRDKGDFNQARGHFEQATRRTSTARAAYQALAEMSLVDGRYADAISSLEKILRQDPGNRVARLLHAVAKRGLKQNQAARDELGSLLKDYPDDTDVHLQLALLDLSEKQYRQAENRFFKLYRAGSRDLRPLAGLVETYTAQREYARANRLLEEEARKSLKPDRIRAAMAGVAAQAQDYSTALAHYRVLLQQHPDAAPVYQRLGELYRQTGDALNAVYYLERAVERSPNVPGAVLSLASTLEAAGRPEEAQNHYRKVLALAPGNPQALARLAYFMSETGQNLDEALGMVEQARRAKPDSPMILDVVGYVYVKKQWAESAVKVLAPLVKKHGDEPLYRYHLALALIDKGDKPRAKEELRAALVRNPSRGLADRIIDLLSQSGHN